MIELHNRDCMEAMKEMPDKAFDLAIVDPPYGIERFKSGSIMWAKAEKYKDGIKWDVRPGIEYFAELKRVSQNQIIWGANHLGDMLGAYSNFIFWYKRTPAPNFSDGELAYTSFKGVAKCFDFMCTNLVEGNDNVSGATRDKRIHPTQKPVKLYEWILKNYAKQGDKILDTHLGSGSIAIACYNMGYSLTGYEIDKDYYEAAMKRLEEHKRQGRLFDAVRV